MGTLGIPEMMFIFTLALLLFGPKKLPELGKTVGKAIAEFRSEFRPSEPSSCRFIYLRRQQCLDALRLSHYVNQRHGLVADSRTSNPRRRLD